MKKSILLIIGLLSIILAGCSVEDQGTDTGDQGSQANSTQSQIDRTIELDAFNYGYSMENITIEEGDRVQIVMTSTQGYHDFVIDALDVQSAEISAGGTTTFEFVANETGEFPFYCSIGNHRERGMEGTLTVQ